MTRAHRCFVKYVQIPNVYGNDDVLHKNKVTLIADEF